MWRIARSPAVWIGLTVSTVALYLALRGLQWNDVGQALADANYGLLFVALLLVVVTIVMRAFRWRVLFHPRRDMRFNNLFGGLNIGYSVNNLTPLRLGEVVRAYAIGETERVSVAHALSTILVERTLDTLTVVAFLMITVPFIDAPGWARGPVLILGLGFLVLALLLAALSAAREGAMRAVSRGVRFLPERFRERVERGADAAIEGFGTLRQPWVLAQATAWSVASWIASAAFVYVVLRAFGMDQPFTAAMFVMAATSLGMIVPAAPGYVGVYHAIAIESLTNVFGADRSSAASFALVSHAIMYLTPMVLAAFYLWRERSLWQRVRGWMTQRQDAVAIEAAEPAEPAEQTAP
jgi:uncharacterized protein (TIRG00374 family)